MGCASVVTYDHTLNKTYRGTKRKAIDGAKRPSKQAKIINYIVEDYSRQLFYQSAYNTLLEWKFDDQQTDDHKAESEHDLKGDRIVSLTDSFTADGIKQHLSSLNRKNEKIIVSDDVCQLCGKENIMFAAPPMDCSRCEKRIKPGSICYRTEDSGVRYSFCAVCYNKFRNGRPVAGNRMKEELVRGKNDGKGGEGWVHCDNCKRWQHQICALYNSEYDVEGKMTYFCPKCRLCELDQAVKNLDVTPILGARDLPRTEVSDHIEQRLFNYLSLERICRATLCGKQTPEEVPGAEDLVVRTVLAVDRRVKVKPQYLDILPGENYPSEFPYKSKVIMLFQKVEGVEVCLFAMYVQEYGTDCGRPNQRSVYISYIDSVKYFTPDIKTFTGKHLRTCVYHEMLIGYLDYMKQCGFNTCYIWACPPVKGDDYILYCHPETQKTPKPETLRKWYKTMLNEAVDCKVVAEYTNFYNYFFVSNDKITAARLPYFDGGYWTGAIENMIETRAKNSTGELKKKPKKSMTKRTYKAMGHNGGASTAAATDIEIMTELGDKLLTAKDDFFVVRLQFTCMSCREAIPSESRWSCNECCNFHLCNRCLEFEQSHEGLVTHTTDSGEKHALIRNTSDAATSTKEKDVIIDNEIFESRHGFLSFCQKNNYQFDSLRRAKHSSMMILYHLHKLRRI